MSKREKKGNSKDEKVTENVENETVENSNENAAENGKSKSQPGNTQNVSANEPLSPNKPPTDDDQVKKDSDNVQNQSNKEKAPEKVFESNAEYYIDDVVNKGGYGRFQIKLTCLAGLGWFADACEIIILSYLADLLACQWTVYRWEKAMLTSVVFFCMMIGAPVFSMTAAIFGRKKAIGLSMLFLFSCGAGSSLSNDFTTIVILRSVMGFALGGIAQNVALCCEYYPTVDRKVAGFHLTYFWSAGTIVLILFTWLIMTTLKNWRVVVVVASLPGLICFLAIRWYPESAHYYLVRKKTKKAVEQLENLARMNKVEMPQGRPKLPKEDRALGSVAELFKPEHRVSTLLMWYLWFSLAFSYYAYVLVAPIIIVDGNLRGPKQKLYETGLNSTISILGSVIPCTPFTRQNYIDLLWTSATEFPGLFIFTVFIRYMNHRTLLTASCLLTVVVTFFLLLDVCSKIVKIFLFIGRANLIAAFQMIFIMTTEMFPSTLRTFAMGTGSGLARLGGAIVPFAAQLLVISNPVLTILIMAIVLIFAALAAFHLPKDSKDKALMGKYFAVMTQEHVGDS